jgi:hypothetical protein
VSKEKNVFISHFGKDDEHVGNLKELMKQKGYTLKNSSIDSTKPNEASNPDYIRALLRSRIEWAGITLVLIGPNTHTREWVNWEIEYSKDVGNRIVGIFIEGASDSDVPESFEKYGDALVGWRSDRIADAIEGRLNNFEKVDGTQWANRFAVARSNC